MQARSSKVDGDCEDCRWSKFSAGMKTTEQTTTNAKANAGVLPLRQTQGQNDKLFFHDMLFTSAAFVNLPDCFLALEGQFFTKSERQK